MVSYLLDCSALVESTASPSRIQGGAGHVALLAPSAASAARGRGGAGAGPGLVKVQARRLSEAHDSLLSDVREWSEDAQAWMAEFENALDLVEIDPTNIWKSPLRIIDRSDRQAVHAPLGGPHGPEGE